MITHAQKLRNIAKQLEDLGVDESTRRTCLEAAAAMEEGRDTFVDLLAMNDRVYNNKMPIDRKRVLNACNKFLSNEEQGVVKFSKPTSDRPTDSYPAGIDDSWRKLPAEAPAGFLNAMKALPPMPVADVWSHVYVALLASLPAPSHLRNVSLPDTQADLNHGVRPGR